MKIKRIVEKLLEIDQAPEMATHSRMEELGMLRTFWGYIRDKDPAYIKALQSDNSSAKAVLNVLNDESGKNFRDVASTINMIRARLKEYSEDELIQMVKHRVMEWTGTDMQKYIRPQTLFNATKCSAYVADAEEYMGQPF